MIVILCYFLKVGLTFGCFGTVSIALVNIKLFHNLYQWTSTCKVVQNGNCVRSWADASRLASSFRLTFLQHNRQTSIT